MTLTKETAETEQKRQFSVDRILQSHQLATVKICYVLTYRQVHRCVINNNK